MSRWYEWQEAPAADYAVLGDPISHSRSPAMHMAAYQALDLDLSYQAIRVDEESFQKAVMHLNGLGYKGLNCTIPLKELAAAWVEEADEESSIIGAINTLSLSDRKGTNTDAPAMLNVVESNGVERGSRVLILGAGGTGRAALVAFCRAGYQVSAWNRTAEKLDALRDELSLQFTTIPALFTGGYDLVINTTSSTLAGEPLGVSFTEGSGVKLAFDVGYGKPSQFLAEAAEAGIPTLDGLPLLVEQGALALEWWLGKSAPRKDMLAAVQ